jgi:hypothetical protein
LDGFRSFFEKNHKNALSENHITANYENKICGNDIFFIVFADFVFIICGTRDTNILCINREGRSPERPIAQRAIFFD